MVFCDPPYWSSGEFIGLPGYLQEQFSFQINSIQYVLVFSCSWRHAACPSGVAKLYTLHIDF